MALENQENLSIGAETKGLFRSVSTWMKIFAIIMFVILGLFGICILIISANKDGKIVAEIFKQAEMGPLKEMLGVILGFVLVAVVLMFYACTKLFKASNHFTSISYTSKPDDYTSAFKSLKTFWMVYGIVIIISIVFIIYMVSRMLSIIQEMAH